MAWVVQTNYANSRSTVAPRIVPETRELWKMREAYKSAHPHLFPTGAAAYEQGVHLPRELYPTEGHIETKTRNPPNFINLSGYGVSERVKWLIERLEPDVHQFVEVPIFLRDGTPAPQRYYAMALGHVARHQVDDELTTMRRTPKGKVEPPGGGDGRGIIFINRNETRDWHAWFSADIYNMFTISD